MKLLKKIIVLICLSSMLMSCNLSSREKLTKKEELNKIDKEKIKINIIKKIEI